ncbi:hypothetical protein FDP41_009751 [Naegleria fowleri]|uniref:Uncharacterized protein n=1 Tax=Naegleria fowleri TaxID=5763 RepID=A0A6A5BD76_NAEFO|nr:uncharacterized protein FDP41_009751 [Naegleria fowleri]KAF0972055.1 hypothetical protein FDP41_009751 [Naegleria fowleri]CAG4709939.1 unnamed protein product [Naegleria fowleri]
MFSEDHVFLQLADLNTPSSSSSISKKEITLTKTSDNSFKRPNIYSENEFHDDDLYFLMKLLQQKMRTNKVRRNKSFSMDPKDVFLFSPDLLKNIYHSVYNEEYYVSDLYDVKISYNLKCILVSDFNHYCIEVFDLETKEYKFKIKAPDQYMRFMCVEENYDMRHNDALIFGCSSYVYKYDLKTLLTVRDEANYIWKNEDCSWAQGIAISYSRRQVFVSDAGSRSKVICILNLQTGQSIQKFSIEEPLGVAFSPNEEYLIVSCADTSIYLFREDKTPNEAGVVHWTKCKTLVEKETGENGYNFELLTVDTNNRTFVLCDSEKRCLKIFSLVTFEQIATIGSESTPSFRFKYIPFGLCVNELTGELLVCETEQTE